VLDALDIAVDKKKIFVLFSSRSSEVELIKASFGASRFLRWAKRAKGRISGHSRGP